MILLDKLIGVLLGYTDVAAVVGARVFPLRAPQQTAYPRLLVKVVSDREVYSHNGSSNLTTARVQISCEALTYTAARVLAGIVRAHLTGFRGSWGGMAVQSCFFDTESDLYLPPSLGDDTARYTVEQDYLISYDRGQ